MEDFEQCSSLFLVLHNGFFHGIVIHRVIVGDRLLGHLHRKEVSEDSSTYGINQFLVLIKDTAQWY